MTDWNGRRDTLVEAARRYGTPSFVYFAEGVRTRVGAVRHAFSDRFGISYSVKANPNPTLLGRIASAVDLFDCSSWGEIRRLLALGVPPSRLSFCSPAKRPAEVRAASEAGIGLYVAECVEELTAVERRHGEEPLKVLLRINPREVPPEFGVRAAGRPSQFGVDEEDLEDALGAIARFRQVRLVGFHAHSGINSLSAAGVAANLRNCQAIFAKAAELAEIRPEDLIFGAGFGIAYHEGQVPLALGEIASGFAPALEAIDRDGRTRSARLWLELGRYLAGPEGYLLTRVVRTKRSRGALVAICDAGFNNNLAACGMLGSVIRRNWRLRLLSEGGSREESDHLVTGPLCTTVDQIATSVRLPTLQVGDLLAIEGSGAYGLTASPTRFISHPEPREVVVERYDGRDVMLDATVRELPELVEAEERC